MVLVMSGFSLWWPRQWTRLALNSVAIPRLSLSDKPRNWNWHSVVGFMQEVREVILIHAGEEYFLRMTNNGQRILTKSSHLTQPPRANL
jgi:uncharacterized iron-regulated membrane protein